LGDARESKGNGNGNRNGNGNGNRNRNRNRKYGGPSPYRVRMTAENWQQQRQL